MNYCRVCGRPTNPCGWRWFVCENCEAFQNAVHHLAEEYSEDIPEMARKALEVSLNQYNTRTGLSITNEKARSVRESMALTRKQKFYGAFRRPSQVHNVVSGIAASLLKLILQSGFLPTDLTNEVQGFLDEIDSKTKQLTRVLTYQRHDQQWCAFLANQIDEEALGKTEEEALENIYRAHPELRIAS